MRNDATVNSAFLSASNAYSEFDASTKQDKYASVGYGYDKNAAIGFDANTSNLTIGKSKRKKAKKEKSDEAKSSDEAADNKDTISKKHSILGLGLPSSMRLGEKVEGGKQFGATILPPVSSTCLSVDSCAPVEHRASINSTASSLRPISVTSSISGALTADSRWVSDSSSLGVGSILAGRQHRASTQSKESTGAGSIRWDHGILEREKEKVSGESTRRSSLDPKQKEEARRMALGDVFPELASSPGSRRTSGASGDGAASKRSSRSSTRRDGRFKYPILTIEEATNDSHSVDDRSPHGYHRGSSGNYDVDTVSTPLKKARQRPRSEQLLVGFWKSRSLGPADVLGMGSSRPGALYEDDDVLSAATNDLEKLINVLDLQATPCTPDLTPLKPSLSPYASEPSSVVSNRLLNAPLVSMDRMSSIASLRAFAAASASKMPSSFKKESDTRTQSNKTKSNSKSLSKLKQIKALCNASPTVKKSTSVNSAFSLGSTNAANTATIRASGGVKAIVARLNEQSSQSQLSSLFNHISQRETSRAASSRVKVEEGSLEVNEDDIVAEVMKAAESKVKRDEEEKRKVDKKKAEEAERQRGLKKRARRVAAPPSPPVASKEESGCFPGAEGTKPSQCLTFGHPQALEGVPIRLKEAFCDDSGDENGQSDLSKEVEYKSPITKEARRILGRSLGGSDVSAYQVEVDESDPDSDVPEELRVILRKDNRAVKAYGTGHNARVSEQDDDVFSDEDDFNHDGEGYTINHDNITLDVTTDKWSVEVPRSAPAVFTQQPIFSASHLGVLPTGSPLGSSVGLGNSVGLSSSMASVATVRQASTQRLPVFRAQLVPNTVITAPSLAPASTTTYPVHQLTSARLNQSGDRLSFVEQLESAFKTPSKVDLDFNSDMFKIGFGIEDAPLVPDLPKSLQRIVEDERSVKESMKGSVEGSLEESMEESMEAFKLRIASRQATTNNAFLSVGNSSANVSQAHTSGFLADDDYSEEPQADLSISELMEATISPGRPHVLQLPIKVNDSNLKRSTWNKSNSISSLRSWASDGELNHSFRFGGLSSSQGSSSSPVEKVEVDGQFDSKIELTLSDIIPSPRHAREISFHSSMLDDYEDSGLKSMLSKEDELPVKELPPLPASIAPQAMNNSGDVFSDSSRETKRISFVPLTRPSSNVSFAGMDSFDEVRRGFEFHDYRPAFYPAEATALPTGPSGGRYSHRKAQDSVWSIASVSSYGHVLRDGAADPFDYGMAPPVPALPEHLRQHNRMISEVVSMEGSMEGTDYTDSMSFEMSTNVDDTFSFIKNRPAGHGRRRVDSDASSFYFTHRRRESNWSVSSIPGIPGMPPPPPISMFTRGHHRKTSSVTSASSIALSYAMHGAMGGRAILARHRRETSMDSMMEEDHSMHRRSFARPGLGDKMFETSANYLDAIAGSPSGSIDTQQEHAGRVIVSSYEQPSISVVEDSLFDKSGVRSEVSSDCVFGDSNSNADRARRLPNAQFRPLSLISNQSAHDSMHEDDTMISMIGGGHVRRLSVGSQIEASPCVRIEKRRPRQRHRATARMVYQGTQLVRIDANRNEVRDSKAGGKLHNIVEKPSIASTSSMTFGDNRMGNARRGLLERQSLEASCLVAEGEDNSLSYEAVPVFTRPMPAGRQRSSTQSSCTTSSESSSGIDTPPLSPSNGLMSGGSISSIDPLDPGSMLVDTTNPVSILAAARTSAIADGTGHHPQYSHPQRMSISCTSHYEMIEEESNVSSSESDTPNRSLTASVTRKLDSSIKEEPMTIYVVNSHLQRIISVD
ncbi:hypothetical protein BKA70DRAFT_1515472 [Coprinopsis sp. MPI-PUGE-AT-0042]|nr:hypothetical protein BKA70DRAFT_1515472 [Coprinopsis sp. MPI-PUGE-AT-0042]